MGVPPRALLSLQICCKMLTKYLLSSFALEVSSLTIPFSVTISLIPNRGLLDTIKIIIMIIIMTVKENGAWRWLIFAVHGRYLTGKIRFKCQEEKVCQFFLYALPCEQWFLRPSYVFPEETSARRILFGFDCALLKLVFVQQSSVFNPQAVYNDRFPAALVLEPHFSPQWGKQLFNDFQQNLVKTHNLKFSVSIN